MLEKSIHFRYLEYIKQITASKQLFKMSSIHLESLCTYVQGVPMPLLNDLLDGDNLPTPSPWPKVTITKSPLGPKKFRVILFFRNFLLSWYTEKKFRRILSSQVIYYFIFSTWTKKINLQIYLQKFETYISPYIEEYKQG